MSDLAKMISDTSNNIINLAESSLKELDSGKKIAFDNTAYHLPLAYALLGKEIKQAGEAKVIIESARKLWNNQPLSNGLSVPYVDGLLNKGLATLFCEELLTAINYTKGKAPSSDWVGFIPDTVLRSLGLQLVDGRIAGIAVILGRPKDSSVAAQIIREFQEKNIVSVLVGDVDGETFADQLKKEKVEMGLDNYIVPLGPDALSSIFAVNFAIRAPLTFGGCTEGQWKKNLEYCQERVPAFVLVLGKLDEVIVTTGMGVLALGFPIITDMDAPQVPKIETTKFDAIVTEKDYKKIVSRCMETRGIKIKVHKINIPVMYGPAFEGERVRKESLYVEFGGKKAIGFEFLKYADMDKVEDGKVELIGPDIDNIKEQSLPLGIVVEVACRNANKDLEPILERQIHRYLNEAQGIMHMGQRDIVWIRISQDGFKKGLRLKHFGIIIHAMIHQEYSAIVDKVQVKIYSKKEDVEKQIKEARVTYAKRDERLSGMTDESVEDFYSCALCQSFAPNHICIITPERLGLCGAYSWLDAKANFQISPSGANQPIQKGKATDVKLGQWKNINDFVYEKSNKTIEKVSMYSLLESPQSSCGCFECIVALVPEANGVLIVHRDYSGDTPLGMKFTTLASSVGGGVQTPGFLGVGKLYLTSKKFISAEGGIKRIVWMPQDLKEFLRSKLEARGKDIGDPDFINKIADETKATTLEQLLDFLKQVKHPALEMPSLI
ncbi:MAG: acetyl-CoA decarbonylase/synthase complex subunit alpha/beta [Candidatus Omnitrophica bacterium]|nr:acetyl-CoA decarbonylase/synthase complex subunit alpha/beta [Candidatus Omnitrophota bacterium]MDD5351890.1 acetyl-CoA decarbonylase/synthase complex subunit alpha/beta [Candidatus Omnitrophota bacterium]MDD5550716.1 acetyl-CoA decarbonylase/synthase complex subunit alpha/beta [Candidatus Omnitrophota bacterium]